VDVTGQRRVTGARRAPEQRAEPQPARWPARVLAAAVALLVAGPALGPGFVLLRDMVFVPRQDLDLDALGLSGALPRAVPVDAAMALVTAVVPGDLVQKAVLLATVYAAVLGAARLVPGAAGRSGVGAALPGLVAGLVYGWSPYLAERLLMGHWTLLLAWAALPWIARATLRLREGQPGAVPRLLLALAPAALSPTGALLAAGVVAALAGRRRVLAGLGLVLALALPWLVAGALAPGGGGSDPAGVPAFALRSEGWAGSLVAALGTGGVWNAGAVPPSRTSAFVPLVTLLLLALAVVGWLRVTRTRVLYRDKAHALWGLLPLGAAGLLLACAGTVPVLADLLEVVVREVPGGGLLRDGQKWLAWFALPLAVGAGLGARELARRAAAAGGTGLGAVVAGLALLLPVVAVPDLAWGVGGRLQPVAYPSDWQAVRDLVAASEEPGDVLVLPFGAYRAFGWNGGRPQLDPAPRWLPRPAVVDDDLVVSGRTVQGEDPRAREVGAVVEDPGAMARQGVGWVLVEKGTPGRQVPAAVGRLPLAYDGPDLELHRVPDAVAAPEPSLGRVIAVGSAHAFGLLSVGGAALWIMLTASTVTLRRRPLRKRVSE
jgi:hypothetical protein